MAISPLDEVRLYTDGSGTKGTPGGWAAVALDWTGQRTFSGYELDPSTNNRMELMAVIGGLEGLGDQQRVVVVSDSAYVINGFCLYLSGWVGAGWKTRGGGEVANRDLWERLLLAVNRHKVVRWEKIRGHSGDRFNDLADELAGKERRRALDRLSDT